MQDEMLALQQQQQQQQVEIVGDGDVMHIEEDDDDDESLRRLASEIDTEEKELQVMTGEFSLLDKFASSILYTVWSSTLIDINNTFPSKFYRRSDYRCLINSNNNSSISDQLRPPPLRRNSNNNSINPRCP